MALFLSHFLIKKTENAKNDQKRKTFLMITFRLQLTDFQKLYSFLGDTKNIKSQISNTCAICNVTKLFLNAKIWHLHYFYLWKTRPKVIWPEKINVSIWLSKIVSPAKAIWQLEMADYSKFKINFYWDCDAWNPRGWLFMT